MVINFFPENRIRKKISHQNHIFDVSVLQIKPLKGRQIVPDKLPDQLVIMSIGFFQLFQTFPDTHTSHFKALSSHKRIFVKKRNLKTATSYVKDCGSLLYDLFKA